MVLKLTNGRAGTVYEYHYEPHLQLEQAHTVRNLQVLDTLGVNSNKLKEKINVKVSYKMNEY